MQCLFSYALSERVMKMALVNDMRTRTDKWGLGFDESILPVSLVEELKLLLSKNVKIDEVRLRTGKTSTVTSDGANIPLGFVADKECIDRVVSEICEHSLYAHAHTIREGYVTLTGGVRVGIVGRAALEGERVIGVYDVSSLCFRVPRVIDRIGGRVCDLIRQKRGGVLVFSPPGVGKTTLLKGVISSLADTSCGRAALRVSVIDTRGELRCLPKSESLCVDMLTGYPKHLGIEIAARTMNTQLIVCDEISGEAEIGGILQAQNCGVPLLATAHSSEISSLFKREGFLRLHKARVFEYYVGIARVDGERDFLYTVIDWEEANGYI